MRLNVKRILRAVFAFFYKNNIFLNIFLIFIKNIKEKKVIFNQISKNFSKKFL